MTRDRAIAEPTAARRRVRPNHIGMPIMSHGISVDFLRRQVLMSRDIRGGPVVQFLRGGPGNRWSTTCFPACRVRTCVVLGLDRGRYCRRNGILYTETSIWWAYTTILRYLNRVGLRQRTAFAYPLVQQYWV
jgi:hypothetical protein